MNLFTFKHLKANPIEHPVQYKAGTREWRWAFVIEKFIVGFFHQYKSERSDEWHDVKPYYYVAWNPNSSRWGRFHGYYDGPLDSFELGRLQCHWSDWTCKECMGPDANKDIDDLFQ